MPRILLLLPTASYRAPDFMAAAAQLGVEVVVGSEHRQALASSMGDRAVVVPLGRPDAAVEIIVALHQRAALDAIVAVDDQGQLVAAVAGERLGLPHNPPDAVSACLNKAVMRTRLAAATVAQPRFGVVAPGDDLAARAADIGFPCVIKPLSLAASQGVIRADDPAAAAAAERRIRAILDERPEPLLVEQYLPGAEVAVEGLLTRGRLEILATFDKPDPMEGPFFEETIYVTPSRHPEAILEASHRVVAHSAAALGLREGPVHAEVRIDRAGAPAVLEVAARSIGGLCGRALRFGAGISLEEVILRHAVGIGVEGLEREAMASGVMMLPIRAGGVLQGVSGLDQARAVEGIVGVEISIGAGRPVVPLPEGGRYLGFIFGRAQTPAQVEAALRNAERCLDVRLRPSERPDRPVSLNS